MFENKLFIFQKLKNYKEGNIFENEVIPFENYTAFKKHKYHAKITFDQSSYQTLNNVLNVQNNQQLLAVNINNIIIHFENLQKKELIHGDLTKLENIIVSTQKGENMVHFVNYKFQYENNEANDEKDLIVLLEKPLQNLNIQDQTSLSQIKDLLQASINRQENGWGLIQKIKNISSSFMSKITTQHEEEPQVFKVELLNSILQIWCQYFRNKKLLNNQLYQSLVLKIGDGLQQNFEEIISEKIQNLNKSFKLSLDLDQNNLYSELLEQILLISLQNQEQQNAKDQTITNLQDVLNDTQIMQQIDLIIRKLFYQHKTLENLKLINDLI